MMQICPSILEPVALSYFSQINRLSQYFNYFQIDIADNQYVNNSTASLDELISVINSDDFHQVIPQSLLITLTLDFHLMVKDYEIHIEKINQLKKQKQDLNIKHIFIHYDLLPDLSQLTADFPLLTIGLCLNPQDHVGDLASHYNLDSIPCLQIMSVVPGAQGSTFIPESLKKVEQLRILGYRHKIYLDGAVNDKTLSIIKKEKYLPDVICPGSFMTKTNFDLTNNFKKLQSFIHETSET